MDDTTSNPTRHIPPKNLRTTAEKKGYYDDVIGAFVDHFVMVDSNDDVDTKPYETVVNAIHHDHSYAAPCRSKESDCNIQAPDRVR